MRVLVLGGTLFLGRHVVAGALERGWEVTLLNRGRTHPELFPEAERLVGDRTEPGSLEVLKGRTWDAVLDTCGYVPRVVRASAEALRGAAPRYTFISTISVYDLGDDGLPSVPEEAALLQLDDPTTEEVTPETYGGLKALCEAACREVWGEGRAWIVRPGLIVGPHDPTDRFTYWPLRLARGGDVLAPSPADAKVQFIDVRDLARWLLDGLEAGVAGTFNATGPRTRMGDVLDACAEHAPAGTRILWTEPDALEAQEVTPFQDLPLWVTGASASLYRAVIERAVAAGLGFTPLAQAVADTLAWAAARPEAALKAGLTPEREAEIVAKLYG